jgi:glycine/D-amino acid oxidase-like deaminating enzyme
MNSRLQFTCLSLVSNFFVYPFGVKHFSRLSGKSVAIIGGGYSGIGCAFQLRHSEARITLYEPSPLGFGGASAVSAGMMHPLRASGSMLPRGIEAFEEALSVLSFTSDHGFNYRKDGIIRYFDKSRESERFRRNSAQFPEVK